jgi:hypothetical protein
VTVVRHRNTQIAMVMNVVGLDWTVDSAIVGRVRGGLRVFLS